MSYLVLARKWRPQTFDELTGQESISKILKNAIIQNKIAHAYIFSGPRGVGKTTTARILAKALNCISGPTPEPCCRCQSCIAISEGSSMDVLEIDGASNTGVDNIRDLRERVRYAPSGGRYKVYIIDEAHMLSTSAFNALLKTLEEPPMHVVFVMATTEPRKIPATVLSRCQHLPFKKISRQRIKERLTFIASSEGLKASDEALDMIARVADGSIRDSLTILDQVSSFSEDITISNIKDLLGISDIETISKIALSIIEGDRKGIINIISEIVDSGNDLKTFLKDLLQFIRNLVIAKISGDTEGIIDISEEEKAEINKLKDIVSGEHLSLILSELIKAEPAIKNAFHPRIAVEMTLIRLSFLSHFRSINGLIKSLIGQQSQAKGARNIICDRVENEQKSEFRESEGKNEGKPVIVNNKSLADIWDAVMKKIDDMDHPLYCKLNEGIVSFGNDEIKIVFNGGLSVLAESVKEKILFLKNLIKDLSGKDISISVDNIEIGTVSKKEIMDRALKNPIVKEALELFDGRIVDVMPIKTVNGEQ